MRYKPIPLPRSVEDLYAIRDNIPLVPEVEDDCCSRIIARTDIDDRDAAQTWLPFLSALRLVYESELGYYRSRETISPAALGDRFLEGVFGAQEIFVIVEAEQPNKTEDIFAAFREHVPNWERHRRTNWETEWRERTERLLEWGVQFEVFERRAEGSFTLNRDI